MTPYSDLSLHAKMPEHMRKMNANKSAPLNQQSKDEFGPDYKEIIV